MVEHRPDLQTLLRFASCFRVFVQRLLEQPVQRIQFTNTVEVIRRVLVQGQQEFRVVAPGMVYEDEHNRVILLLDREFDRLTVQKPARDENPDSGRVLLYRAEIVSERFGRIEKPLICTVCDDAGFAAEFLVPNRIAVETVCCLRGGAGADAGVEAAAHAPFHLCRAAGDGLGR